MDGPSKSDPDLSKTLKNALHDAKQPLSSAILQVSSADRHGVVNDPEAVKALLGEVQKALEGINDRLGDIERILSNKPLAESTFDAGEATASATDRATPLLESVGIEVGLTIAPGRHLVWGSAVMFDRMLFNLLENVARHGQTARSVSVDVKPNAHDLRVSVIDDGIGWQNLGPHRPGGRGIAFCEWFVQSVGGKLWLGDGRYGGHVVAHLPRALKPV